MTPTLQKYSILLLLIFALLAGFIWRIEVEYHGWEGLIWISYYHYAIPISIVLFLIWSNLNIQLTPKIRIALNLIGLIFAIFLMVLIKQSLLRTYMSGPSAFMMHISDDPLRFLILVPYLMVLFLPLLLALTVRIFGVKCKPIFVIMGTLFMIASEPVGVYLLELFNDKDYCVHCDSIHTIKSGYLMTLWFFSIGFTFIQATQRGRRIPNSARQGLLDDQTM